MSRSPHGLIADFVGQGKVGLSAAPVSFAIGLAKLRALRRINAIEANALAVNFYGVAVNDASLADFVGKGTHRKQKKP